MYASEINLWGEEFKLPDQKAKTKKIKEKISSPKVLEVSAEKQIKSKKISLADKLAIIRDEVFRVLGKQVSNTICLYGQEALHMYMQKAVQKGRLDVDTETNNSTDTHTCYMVGLCLYVPGEKQAYVPVKHLDNSTRELLPNQVTYAQIKQELQYAIANDVKIIMHHADFDYQVLHYTCNIDLPIYWDTMLAAQVLNENEPASLKEQYISKIDPDQEKYKIDQLFEGVRYEEVSPDVFALYAATDAMMTDRLYEWQVREFSKADNQKVYRVFRDVEMCVLPVVSKMEMRGIKVDEAFNKRLHDKYTTRLNACDAAIDAEINALMPRINRWKLSKAANDVSRLYAPKKTKMKDDELAIKYPLVDERGLRYKTGKALAEQLTDPINLGSPTQLAILFYDILSCPCVDKKQPRATGKDAIKALAEKTHLPLCDLMLERRELTKLISTYIDNIPTLLDFWPDRHIHTHFKQYGAKTGRFSSGGKVKYMDDDYRNVEITGVNMQNIPAHCKELRATYCADDIKTTYRDLSSDNSITLLADTEVSTPTGWVKASMLQEGDQVEVDSGAAKITKKFLNAPYVKVILEEF